MKRIRFTGNNGDDGNRKDSQRIKRIERNNVQSMLNKFTNIAN